MLATSLGCLNHIEASLPRISLRCSQLSHLIHQRWEPSRVSFDTRSWPTACQILVTGLGLILERVAKTMSCQRETWNLTFLKHATETGCFARHYSMKNFFLLPTEEDQLSTRADRWGARTHLLPTNLQKNRSKRTIWFFFLQQGIKMSLSLFFHSFLLVGG